MSDGPCVCEYKAIINMCITNGASNRVVAGLNDGQSSNFKKEFGNNAIWSAVWWDDLNSGWTSFDRRFYCRIRVDLNAYAGIKRDTAKMVAGWEIGRQAMEKKLKNGIPDAMGMVVQVAVASVGDIKVECVNGKLTALNWN